MGQKLGKSSSHHKLHNPLIAESEEVLIKSGALNCPVCYDIYHRCPCVFPCGHSLCIPCLKGLWRAGASGGLGVQKIDCPMCRRAFIFPSIDLVPRNHVLREVLDSLREISEDNQFPIKDENLRFQLKAIRKQNIDLNAALRESEQSLEKVRQQVKFWAGAAVACMLSLVALSLLVTPASC